MTRSAFEGTLTIENGNTALALEDVKVTLVIKNANGVVVNELFGITLPELEGLTGVDGNGMIAAGGKATAQWTFIPTGLAASEAPQQYQLGGTLSYTENGATVEVPMIAPPITVYPQAELTLDYFHQRDVFADDPFTTDVVEASVPFELAVLVKNSGKGDAKNLLIESAQPKIIENEKGLLIDFNIIGTKVNNQDTIPALKADFGTIKSGETGVASWLLKSSLQGKFIDYETSFKHLNNLGKTELSLIDLLHDSIGGCRF